MAKNRAYFCATPGKVSGRVVVASSGRVNLIPAFRWIPAREIDRTTAARILWTHRRDLSRDKAEQWELPT